MAEMTRVFVRRRERLLRESFVKRVWDRETDRRLTRLG